ncbi:hypothetical protein [Streptomyces xanthochromogenes]
MEQVIRGDHHAEDCVRDAAEEIHGYLVDQLNLALRRPGMFGGEVPLRILMDHVLFVEHQPEAWNQLKQGWEEQGLWSPVGPSGAFRDVFPAQTDCYEVAPRGRCLGPTRRRGQ